MISEWARKKILIWGKTRPELSKTYREIVCTGGVFADNKRLVRLYPIPLRYMDDDKIFKKYQWIEAWVKKSTSDTRPESYKIRSDEITIGETIPSKSGCWDKRAEWIMQSDNIYKSVEALQEKQIADQTSLGLVKPDEIIEVKAERYSKLESDKYWRNYEELVRQMELPIDDGSGREIRPLRPPDYRFKIKFRCRDARCKREHLFSILDWEIDALYFNLRQKGDSQDKASSKVVDKIRTEICALNKDLFFFLGNISNYPKVFTIVGFWWPKLKKIEDQQSLF